MRTLRDEVGFTRAQAASAIGISSEFIRVIERGERTPAAGTARIMLEEYGVEFNSYSENDHYIFVIRGHKIEFLSRIQESRNDPAVTRRVTSKHDELLGEVVRHLASADEAVLHYILYVLRKEVC